jgi:hypothetical protein
MANITWPELLPSGLLEEGFSKEPQSNVIRTAMDAGPKKARRRYTARAVNYSGRQVFDAAELAVFEQFYHTVLADGVLRFNFADPVTGETGEFRFTKDYSSVAFEGCFKVTVSLERLT